MNIVFVYRKKIQGRYSLENVFNSLIPHLKKRHNIRIYYTRGRKFLFQDIFHLRSLKADIYHIVTDNFHFLFQIVEYFVMKMFPSQDRHRIHKRPQVVYT